jgi:hypothetical protein
MNVQGLTYLELCPFCGGVPRFNQAGLTGCCYVECTGCFAHSKVESPHDTPSDKMAQVLADRWNKRVA